MSKHLISSLGAAALLLFVLSACEKPSLLVKAGREGHLERLSIKSPALAENATGDAGERILYVMLPPGYDTGKERYPVIYYLHGQGGDSTEMLRWEESVYNAMDKNQIKPFILVGVNGDNPLGGTFYVNSPSAQWEDHLLTELIPLIDSRYRTVASPAARGLMGFSMGGFGVLHNGLTHSEHFAAVWALCPGVLVPETGLPEAMTSWRGTGGSFLQCYAKTFSATASVPVMDGSETDKAVRDEWENGFGNWSPRIAVWLNTRGSGESTLGAVRIISGSQDFFTWIPAGSAWLAGELKGLGLPVEFQEYPMGHTINAGTVIKDAMPFFATHLARE